MAARKEVVLDTFARRLMTTYPGRNVCVHGPRPNEIQLAEGLLQAVLAFDAVRFDGVKTLHISRIADGDCGVRRIPQGANAAK